MAGGGVRGFALAVLAAAAAAADDDGVERASPGTDGAALYEAYNQLHALSQQLGGATIDSPTVVVVGRQTDGKSALLEALMGFQFNHVGGGTKTRRPIALQMQYHPERESPVCFLHTADGELEIPLAGLQAHIEQENQRLAMAGTFAAEEIVVRIEYRYCPNLSIVDTPGMLTAAASAAGADAADDAADSAASLASGAGAVGETSSARRARLQAAQVESLVLSKIKSEAAIVLCVEESSNWEVAPARAVVAHADPGLARTVVVSTKLDTKFAQFSSPAELGAFLGASPLRQRHPNLLGGPFFTSVPAGRVGSTRVRARTHASSQTWDWLVGDGPRGPRLRLAHTHSCCSSRTSRALPP